MVSGFESMLLMGGALIAGACESHKVLVREEGTRRAGIERVEGCNCARKSSVYMYQAGYQVYTRFVNTVMASE